MESHIPYSVLMPPVRVSIKNIEWSPLWASLPKQTTEKEVCEVLTDLQKTGEGFRKSK